MLKKCSSVLTPGRTQQCDWPYMPIGILPEDHASLNADLGVQDMGKYISGHLQNVVL